MSSQGAPIREADLVSSVADALQYIAVFHPPSFVRSLAAAYEREESPAARDAIRQILINSRMAAFGRRPICQDTGTVNVFVKLGIGARIETARPLTDLINEGVARAYTDPDNPLRASIVRDPLFGRTNTGDNTPAVVHFDVVAGDALTITVAAKGGGSENKAKFANLAPAASVSDWVVETVETLGAGWCPPGLLGIGVGGTAEKSMMMAKEALLEPIDMAELLRRGPSSPIEEMRLEIHERVNALGIGAQGLGGLTTVVDVKIRSHPCHAASKPVGLIPQCAADRHLTFTLDGSGPARLTPPDLSLWPELDMGEQSAGVRRIDLDRLTREEVATWRAGETLLLSGRMLTGRDAAHKRIVDMIRRGEPLPVALKDRAIYYVGPVDPVREEVVGPAGPTTATRMDGFTDLVLDATGLLVMIGKAERGPAAIESIRRYGAAYLIAVGGAAYLVSKAVKAARVLAFADLGMEAIHEFVVEDMPVTVAVDAEGNSIHRTGPSQWRRPAVTVKGSVPV
ncbi:fumarate hydratase [Aureimonas phyllosphaerae]|uniref:Fumarate hydratase class I n=1 Tax=Aureimonas phyllosphaerae TaxID=1166078 RepID=A0A7W6BUI0_9HYPH|nr:fumarate hydratase [Aureimonas phyllosphaerae]MBB3936530.1 fumarate hydratase class I [Aureimonas phyllosphaerae]MBB3960606.1 fumarate hydratase class I [Aureimonas phyllosphaerae]SFF28989.1 fumarase, class I, homodimeric [Aureimonas phyllosphaerae]